MRRAAKRTGALDSDGARGAGEATVASALAAQLVAAAVAGAVGLARGAHLGAARAAVAGVAVAGAAAALACLAETQRHNVPENAAARGAQLWTGLQALFDRHNIIGDIRGGHGLMLALELVEDRATKKPIAKPVIAKVQEAAYRAGAMIRISGPNIIISPPLVATAADAQAILDALEAGLSAV